MVTTEEYVSINFKSYVEKVETNKNIRGASHDWQKWVVCVDADDNVLNKIEYIDYQLPPGYAEFSREIYNKPFRFDFYSWGKPNISIVVRFKDGDEREYKYILNEELPYGKKPCPE